MGSKPSVSIVGFISGKVITIGNLNHYFSDFQQVLHLMSNDKIRGGIDILLETLLSGR